MLRGLVSAALLGRVHAGLKVQQPASDADIQHSGDTGYPCPASGSMIEACEWYKDFIKENPDPPRSVKKPYIYGGSEEFHDGDPEMLEACEKNYEIICVKKNPLCEEYFDKCEK
eukprot:gnl/MRDRNA2_/MRDRNA2_112341_c0_seq1.p1 gnl/MRDRNA2_/MRDRNA2_112341_c0~~gnl/MRDRNA2_/MRDRNA2_112341_c0_seq1.p1  ORF type:complete len:114 (-),score=26.25 gnl/MRDRNA2_/MRDRNA2_112341_c0_seq1:7-348(-)